jgi:TRAP-type C4-dicarboxylate transport system permease small subunit
MNITGTTWFGKSTKYTDSISRWFERVGLLALAAMGLTTIIDVIGSKVFQWPLPGSTEITSVIQVVAIAGGLAFSKIDGRQIRVEFLFDSLPVKGQAALDIFSAILGLGLFIVAGWMTYEHGLNLFNSGTKTFLLGIPLYPFAFWIAFCCIPMCFVLILDLIDAIDRMIS